MSDHDEFEDRDPALEALLRATFRAEAARRLPDDRPVPAAAFEHPAAARPSRRRRLGLAAVAAGLVAAGVAAALVGHEAMDATPRPTPAGTSVAPTTTSIPSVTSTPGPTTTGGGTAGPPPAAATTAPAAPVGPAGGPVPAGFVPVSATFVSADDGWVLGTTASCGTPPCTSIVRTRDGGRTWVGIPAPRATLAADPTVPGQVEGIRFADATNGWAFGRQLWATHDGGASWHQVSGIVEPGGSIADIETGGGSVYLVTAVCTTQPGGADPRCSTSSDVDGAATTSDDFHRLTTVLSASQQEDPRLAVHGADWWVSGQGTLLRGSGLHGPSPVAPICAADRPPGLVTPADSTHLDGLCYGPGGAGGSTPVQLRGSSDGGRSWIDSGPGFRASSGADQISDNGAGVLLFAAASAASDLLRTTDDGGSFSLVVSTDAGYGVQWTDAGFTTSSQAFAVLPGQLMYLSTDAGASWQKVTFGG